MVNTDKLYNDINKALIDERFEAVRGNIMKNLPLIREHGGLKKVVPLLRDKHVIICGAGPSLDDSLVELKKYQLRNELVILAVDMALKPLARAGVTPAFVISCESTPLPFFRNINTENIHLLAFSGMSSINVRQWKGPMSFYNWMLHSEPFASLWKESGEGLGYVATASIVTTQAVSLALGCGIRSLLLAGNDMAFRSRYYCSGSIPVEQAFFTHSRINPAERGEYERIRRKKHYMVQRRNTTWFTDHQFLAAKEWLEKLFNNVQVPVYDCSNPGCGEGRVRKAAMNEILKELLPSRRKRRK